MGSKVSDYKYDKSGRITHFKYNNPRSKKDEYATVDEPGNIADHVGEKLTYGMDYPEFSKARKDAQKARGD